MSPGNYFLFLYATGHYHVQAQNEGLPPGMYFLKLSGKASQVT
jgi:hypothetical protein